MEGISKQNSKMDASQYPVGNTADQHPLLLEEGQM